VIRNVFWIGGISIYGAFVLLLFLYLIYWWWRNVLLSTNHHHPKPNLRTTSSSTSSSSSRNQKQQNDDNSATKQQQQQPHHLATPTITTTWSSSDIVGSPTRRTRRTLTTTTMSRTVTLFIAAICFCMILRLTFFIVGYIINNNNSKYNNHNNNRNNNNNNNNNASSLSMIQQKSSSSSSFFISSLYYPSSHDNDTTYEWFERAVPDFTSLAILFSYFVLWVHYLMIYYKMRRRHFESNLNHTTSHHGGSGGGAAAYFGCCCGSNCCGFHGSIYMVFLMTATLSALVLFTCHFLFHYYRNVLKDCQLYQWVVTCFYFPLLNLMVALSFSLTSMKLNKDIDLLMCMRRKQQQDTARQLKRVGQLVTLCFTWLFLSSVVKVWITVPLVRHFFNDYVPIVELVYCVLMDVALHCMSISCLLLFKKPLGVYHYHYHHYYTKNNSHHGGDTDSKHEYYSDHSGLSPRANTSATMPLLLASPLLSDYPLDSNNNNNNNSELLVSPQLQRQMAAEEEESGSEYDSDMDTMDGADFDYGSLKHQVRLYTDVL